MALGIQYQDASVKAFVDSDATN
ncbi:uncharacterized protein G2W53_019349 [Senna tora]|uniref:Uncharacterized protein n=1 Tax=Senna tora TaxID=362788 RepID=A0A834WLX6_9FABA|nr:uncharacterized protein G2W53_019349 [Senna tora]